MTNVTTRIAVKINHLPPFEFNWSDSTPQKARSSLVLDDVLPSPSDGSQLFERAVKYVMEFLLKHFPSLKDIKVVTPQQSSSHQQEKSTVIPMAVLQRDEKYTDETIKILHDYTSECDFKGDLQVNEIQ